MSGVPYDRQVLLDCFPILRSLAARKDSAVHVSLSSIQPVKQLWSEAPTLLEMEGRRVILRLLNRRLHNNQVVRSVGDASSIHQLAAAARRRWAVYRGQPLLVSTPSNLKNEAPVTLWRTYPAIRKDLRKNNSLRPVHNRASAAVGAAGGHPAG